MVGDVVVVGVLFWYGVNCTVLYVASSLLVRYIRVLHILWKSSNGDNYDGISLLRSMVSHPVQRFDIKTLKFGPLD